MSELEHKPLSLKVAGAPVNNTRLGTELPQPIADYPSFPRQLDVLTSMDFIDYETILEYFTNEDKYFSLNPVIAITAAGQRCIKGNLTTIALAGLVTPDQKLVLTTKVSEAGYPLCEITDHGEGNCNITLVTIQSN